MYIYTDIFNNIKFYKNQETNLKKYPQIRANRLEKY